MTGESVRFDRAAAYYDRTRALPPEVVERQAEILGGELSGCRRVLEIGVGTGRIAVSLDVPVIGLDLSRPMMEVLRAKSATIPLVEGDATRLPFPDGSFDAAYAAHVLHLIPTWEDALAELVRVVRPGGRILAIRSSGATDLEREMNDAVTVRRVAIGANTIEDVDDGARRLGLGVRVLPVITWTVATRMADVIDDVVQGVWSGLWDRSDEERLVLADRVRAWSVERFGSDDAEVPATSSFAWHAYDVPS